MSVFNSGQKIAEHDISIDVTLFSFNEVLFVIVILKVWLKQTVKSSTSTMNAHVAETFENTSFQDKTWPKGLKVIKEPMKVREWITWVRQHLILHWDPKLLHQPHSAKLWELEEHFWQKVVIQCIPKLIHSLGNMNLKLIYCWALNELL